MRPRIIIACLAICTAITMAQADTNFTYQGELKQDGSPANGTYSMSFSLWDHEENGNQIGITQTITDVPVTNGRFTVDLDFGAAPFDNTERWLQISVNATTLSPRQPITRAPYALQTRGIFADQNTNIGIGTLLPDARLHVVDGDATSAVRVESSAGDGIVGRTTSNNQVGVRGEATNSNGHGVIGENLSNGGFGALAYHHPNGSDYGVFGNSSIGVVGISDLSVGVGVFGGASGTTSENFGVIGNTNSPNGWAGYFTGRGYFSDFLGVGRENTITSLEFFGVHAPVDSGYGGMYVSTDGQNAWPFYGYAAGSDSDMWHYYHGSTGQWRLFNDGERLAVENTGEVGINTTSPAYRLEVNGSAGKPGGGSWSNSSDRRLKKNIHDLNGALDRLLALRGVTFEYIDPQAIHELPGRRVGMIAQEVEDVFPDWVDVRRDGYKSVTYRGFEALAVEAMRELRSEQAEQLTQRDQEIESLRSENAELRARIDALETLVHQIVTTHKGEQ